MPLFMGITGVNEHFEPVFNARITERSYHTLWVSYAEVSLQYISTCRMLKTGVISCTCLLF